MLVLLVDDDKLILSTLAETLENEGHYVLTASSANSALELLKSNTPDIGIFDIRMPEMTGVELANRVKESQEFPYIFLTAFDDKELIDEALETGASAYFIKPVDAKKIIPTLEFAVAKFKEFKKVFESEKNLHVALNSNRKMSVAIGIVMERFKLNENDAFEKIRKYSRNERMKVSDSAELIAESCERLNI